LVQERPRDFGYPVTECEVLMLPPPRTTLSAIRKLQEDKTTRDTNRSRVANMDDCALLLREDFRLGRVIAVSACQAIALLEPSNPAASSNRDLPLEMGTLVKMRTRVSIAYGMVTGLRVPLPSLEASDKDLRLVELELVGEIRGTNADGGFQRGVSAYPALDEPVFLASAQDVAQVYARPKVVTTPVGTIHQNGAVPAYILVDELFGKHFSIVGTTGSGKSCGLATILRAVVADSPNAHVVLLDPHNEYTRAFGDRAVTLSPGDGLDLPYWLFNFEELTEIVIGPDRNAEQAKYLVKRYLLLSNLILPSPAWTNSEPWTRQLPIACQTCFASSTWRWAASIGPTAFPPIKP
jgi:Helicase HerA, central domain